MLILFIKYIKFIINTLSIRDEKFKFVHIKVRFFNLLISYFLYIINFPNLYFHCRYTVSTSMPYVGIIIKNIF